MRRSDQLVISPTGISKWRWCPQAWRYRYEQGLSLRRESGKISVGILQHAALEALARGEDPGEAVRVARESRDWSPAPTDAQVAEALAGAAEVWRLVSRLWPGAEVEEVEASLRATHPEDTTLEITGRPDLILRDAAGRRILLDYKRRSGLRRTRPVAEMGPADLHGVASTSRDLQSAIYSLLLLWADRPVDESYLVKSCAAGTQIQILRTTASPEVLAHTSAALLALAGQMRAAPSAADRAYPAEGSCYAYTSPCEYSDLCAAEVRGLPIEALRAALSKP